MTELLNILIVEDNEDDAGLLLMTLNRSPLKFVSKVVHTREDYEHALTDFRPHLILSDYSLPSFDGLSAYFLKEKTLPDIPFIMVSGTIGEENAVELIKTGITDYAIKDKLFVLPSKITRALKEYEEKKAKAKADKAFKDQHQKLLEIAFLQAHQVRRPIATIQGLISLFDLNDPGEPVNAEIVSKLRIAVKEFDDIIREIVRKTNEII
jgi:DNA-binding NtrC family response regulator